MSSQLVTWTLSLAATVVIPRYLGAELIGQLHLADSIWAMGLVVTSFGMDLALVKATARDNSLIGPLMATSVVARLMLFIPVTALLFGYARLAGYPDEILTLLVLVGIGTALQAVSGSASAILKGLDRMGAISVAAILGRLIFVGGAIAMLALGYGIYAVAAVAGAGSLLTLTLQLAALRQARRALEDHSPLRVDRSAIIALLRDSAPYFWISLFIVVYAQVDTIVISLVVARDEVLGWYSIFDRLSATLMFVPTVFLTAVYPTLSRIYGQSSANGDDPAQFNRLTTRTFEVMMLISVPIGIGIAVISKPLVALLFGADFAGAAPAVAVGGLVTTLTYLTTVLGMFLISMDRQRRWTWFIAAGAVMTVPLDFLLVPFFESRFDNGAIGGAAAYVVTEAFMLGGAIFLLPRGALGPSSILYTARVLAAGLIMLAVVYPLRQLNLLVPISAGAIVYGVAVMMFGLLSAPEYKKLLMASAPDALVRRLGADDYVE